MIEYLRGNLVAASPGRAVLEIGGVGISIDLPPVENNMRTQIGQEMTIYTRLVVKDDDIFIYGFPTTEERKIFNLILGVSGFGPRLALSLLAIFSVSQLYVAVIEENVAQLSRAHGVGRKAAQRLILELKEKLPKVISTADLAASQPVSGQSTAYGDLTEALIALGYSPGEAAAAVSRVIENNQDTPKEELLKMALKGMAGD